MSMRRAIQMTIFFPAVLFLLTACASGLTSIAPRPPERYEKLGAAKGTACGSIIIGPTAFNFIPVMLNSRVERAYQAALQSVPGAAAIIDVSVNESWRWWVIGTARCVTVTGEAIR